MKDLRKLYNECVSELKRIHIDVSEHIIEVEASKRLRTSLGLCTYYPITKQYKIAINARLLEDHVDSMEIKNVIMHELVHTCPNCMNHDNQWKLRAKIINQKLGYHISEFATEEEVKAANILLKKEEYNYSIVCLQCGKEVGQQKRWGKRLENINNYRCGLCNGKLVVISFNERRK